MANAFDYFEWRGELPFSAAPFNEVDGMLLSRLSYAPFELVGESRVKRIGKACEELLKIPDIEKRLLMKKDKTLLEYMVESARFNNLILLEYESFTDEETQTQFSATTFQLSKGLFYVAFRGTDETLVGWKENLNMSFTTPVPAQLLAVKYLERIASRIHGRFYVGGHSKGGNLAVYASTFSKPRVRQRVLSVTNYDGPGFDSKVIKTAEYMSMNSKIKTFVPESAVVGMLLEHEEDYIIVKSETGGLLQHDTYSWQVLRDKFEYLESVTEGSLFLDKTIKEWIAELDYSEREKLVDALYDILTKTNAKTVKELGENWPATALSMIKTLATLDDETRRVLNESLRALVKSVKKNANDRIRGIK